MLLTEVHPNLKLMSPSSTNLLHKCPRKYEIYKLGGKQNEETSDTRFGHAVGRGVQELFRTGNRNSAYLSSLVGWDGDLDDDKDDDKRGESRRKTYWHSLLAIDKFNNIRNTRFRDYDLAVFEGRPAIELGFSIDLGDGFYYRGLLDALLINRVKRELEVYEGKTTKYKNVDESQFKYSGQSLGYSVVIDAIAPILGIEVTASYWANYYVWSTGGAEWQELRFKKSHTQRALWIKNMLIDKAHIAEYGMDEYFPMHGESCYEFFRQCEHFGTCEMSNKYLIGDTSKVKVEAEDKYLFKFKLEDIIEAQLRKYGE